jgi:CRP-like cAMP-binding protein
MSEVQKFLKSIYDLPASSMQKLEDCLKPVEFKRKEVITWEGHVEKYLYFVQEGIQKSYYIKDGNEHVIAFTYAPSFSGIPESFLTQTPSKYFLDTITPSKLLRLSYDQLQSLLSEDRHLERLMQKATEAVLAGLIQRHHELLAFDIEERFTAFVKRSPALLNLIPHKDLASYLGINATNFSKLLARVKI